jgi:AraC family transcriptional regulator of arabinose operon
VSYRRVNIEYLVSEDDVSDRRVLEVLVVLQAKPNLRAAQLAPVVGLTTSRLHHLFKREVGVSIGRYAKKIQLNRAAQLLKMSQRSLKEIRNEIGIPNGANFVRHFKQWFGMSPSAYRRLQRTGLTNK